MTQRIPDDVLHEAGGEIPHAGEPIDPAMVAPASSSPAMRKLADVLGEAFDRMDARAEGREKPIATPWDDFNTQLPGGGFFPGCHVLVGGTGSGRSALALQLSLHAARHGAAVAYVGLELDDMQIVLRLAGDATGVGWSKLYTGQALPSERDKARTAQGELAELPIYLAFGDAMGWAATKMQSTAAEMRKAHPDAPLLIVLDFLQLVGPELDAGRQDLRERIGRAAYVARDVARRFGACVLLVSSVAREHYAKVNSVEALELAGVDADKHGETVVERFMRNPDALVGLGKESGEIEYAADSVTTVVGLPRPHGAIDRAVVLATAKLRAGRPGWCSLRFDGHRFEPDPGHGLDVIESLRQNAPTKGANGKPSKGYDA
jgi:replicative DNA helicase